MGASKFRMDMLKASFGVSTCGGRRGTAIMLMRNSMGIGSRRGHRVGVIPGRGIRLGRTNVAKGTGMSTHSCVD